jgi:energy-converting hydrogenase Eha subunit E
MTSKEELASIIPVRPPTVNRKINPSAQSIGVSYLIFLPWMVASHLKTLIPVGTAIIMVAAVKYARVSTSIPTVNM